VSLDQLAAMTGQSDYRRDRWGRPLIKQLDGTHLPYTRASSATKIIEDEYNLNRWHRRNGIYGMAHDASLVARTLAIGGTPDTWDLAEKKALDKIVTDADTVAKAHKGADIGTAVHRIIERVNAGETVDAGPYQADVDAYLAAVERAGLVVLPQFLEVRMVCDPLHLAGTADNIMSRGNGDPYVIADLKTGATVTYGGLGFAGQLAAYANGLLYDVEHEQRWLHHPPPRRTRPLRHLHRRPPRRMASRPMRRPSPPTPESRKEMVDPDPRAAVTVAHAEWCRTIGTVYERSAIWRLMEAVHAHDVNLYNEAHPSTLSSR
jgi:hypothetical protein